MKSLHFQEATRHGSSNRAERHYLDFFLSSQSLKAILGIEKRDLITLLRHGRNTEFDKHILNVFLLRENSELKTGRVMFYACPECGDIGCGAVTAVIEDAGESIVWKDFGYETGLNGVEEEYSHIEPIEIDRQSYFEVFAALT